MRRFVPALVLSFAAFAGPAYAATPPDAATAAATNIGPLGAQLNGTSTANGHATNVRFQYGTTTKYGKSTPAQAIGQGTSPVPVAAAIAGLKSNTRYHYRVVATSSAGTTRGADKSFKTTKPTTALTFTPNPPTFSRPFTVSGQLVGTGAGGATVTLLGRPFPYTAAFTKIGNSVISNADGTYSFAFTAAQSTTQLEIRATTTPAFTSAIATMNVASLISLHVHTRVHKGHLLRMSGSVLPAQDGLIVKFQKRGRDGVFRSVAHTTLNHHSSASSTYSRRLRIKRSGTYQAVVVSNGGQVSPGTSPAVSIRVSG
jgi:hypothetical protein